MVFGNGLGCFARVFVLQLSENAFKAVQTLASSLRCTGTKYLPMLVATMHSDIHCAGDFFFCVVAVVEKKYLPFRFTRSVSRSK